MSSLDQQIDELVALLDSQLASELDPLIKETLLATRAAVIARGDAALTDKMMVATNYTYQSIRDMMDKQAGGLAGLHEDMTGFIRQREEQDDASQRAIQQQASALARIEQQNADQLRIAREGATAVQALWDAFQSVSEGFVQMRDDITAVTVRVDAHDARFDAHDVRASTLLAEMDLLRERIMRLEQELAYARPTA